MANPSQRNHDVNYEDQNWWIPASKRKLQHYERKLLEQIMAPKLQGSVDIGDGNFIATLALNPYSTMLPLVMFHGWSGAIGLWFLILRELAFSGRPIFVIDLPGFGKSSRPFFGDSPEIVISTFITLIEKWRETLGIDRFDLLGHSMGGYVAANYALHYPNRVGRLILADPWGFGEGPDTKCDLPLHIVVSSTKISIWKRGFLRTFKCVNPLWVLRYSGPFGPTFIKWFVPKTGSNVLPKYLYHCNAQKPTGGAAFKEMMDCFQWPKVSMTDRMDDLSKEIPIRFIWGNNSWIDPSPGELIADKRMNVENYYVDADHHVYLHRDFSRLVLGYPIQDKDKGSI